LILCQIDISDEISFLCPHFFANIPQYFLEMRRIARNSSRGYNKITRLKPLEKDSYTQDFLNRLLWDYRSHQSYVKDTWQIEGRAMQRKASQVYKAGFPIFTYACGYDMPAL